MRVPEEHHVSSTNCSQQIERNMGRPVSGTHHHHNVVGRLQAIPHLHELGLNHRSSLVV